jgi:hypothetical protein
MLVGKFYCIFRRKYQQKWAGHRYPPVPEEATNKCDLEVLQYLEDKNKELSILNSYQMVKKVFVRYNAVLPSSAAVERLFSFAGLITRPHRRSMSDKTFEHLLLLKGNK